MDLQTFRMQQHLTSSLNAGSSDHGQTIHTFDSFDDNIRNTVSKSGSRAFQMIRVREPNI